VGLPHKIRQKKTEEIKTNDVFDSFRYYVKSEEFAVVKGRHRQRNKRRVTISVNINPTGTKLQQQLLECFFSTYSRKLEFAVRSHRFDQP
jgi:hypothetical protein